MRRLELGLGSISSPAATRSISPMSHSDDDKPEIVTTTEARAGVTGHNVRYVLGFGLAIVVVAFIAVLLAYS